MQGDEKLARTIMSGSKACSKQATWETSAAGRIILKLDLNNFENVLTGFS
jgi:hypothetical protein